MWRMLICFFFQAEDGIRDLTVTGVQTCALPICNDGRVRLWDPRTGVLSGTLASPTDPMVAAVYAPDEPLLAITSAAGGVHLWNSRSEEHTSELQSQSNLVCRLLLEKKKENTRSRRSHRSRADRRRAVTAPLSCPGLASTPQHSFRGPLAPPPPVQRPLPVYACHASD